ncbi:MAG TPA: TfuA-like protein [Chloroflexia bacterium]
MTVYIFTGPTLAPAAARQELDAVYLPPVAQGDVYQAARRRPQAIGIIDGFFDSVPAIWHKEILWAMREGIHVFGSASMGALRAAELAAFGMEGVGAIFAAYQSGALEDDDVVAVIHGPAESGYRPLSVALVNIRATLHAAAAGGIIVPATAVALERLAKDLFYPERTYPRLLGAAAGHGLPAADLAALRAWLPGGQVDQKAEDARAMLRVIRERLAAGMAPKQVYYHFEHTVFWDQARAGGRPPAPQPDAAHLPGDILLEELQLDPAAYAAVRQATLAHVLARTLAAQQGQAVPDDFTRAITEAFRRARGLFQPEATLQWMATHDLAPAQFDRLMREEALLRWAVDWAGPEVSAHLADQLRLTAGYPALRDRARDKQRTLAAAGLADPNLADAGVTQDGLLDWYFTERTGAPPPADLTQYALDAGFLDEYAFIRAVLREFCYTRLIDSTTPGAYTTRTLWPTQPADPDHAAGG